MTSTPQKVLTETDPQWNRGEVEKFRNLALRYQEIGANEGIKINPFVSSDLPLFQQATAEDRKMATDFLNVIVDIHEETIAGGYKAINTKQLIWKALGKLGLIPGPDVFEKFKDDDIVLIYREDHTVQFWNLQFFKFTSLTVEQMFFERWFNVTQRDPAIQQKLHEMAVNLITGKIKGNFVPDVPGHEVQEVNTLESIRTWMELPFGSTLTKNGNLGGILIVQRMRVI